MKSIEIDPSLMEAEDERCYLDVLLKDENNFSPPLNDSTLDQCNHPTQAGILQLSKNLGKYAENGSQNYLNSNASIADLSISASPPGQVSEENIYCVDSFSSSVIEIENFNQLSESHPVKKEVASVEKILKDAINQVAKKVRADSIPSEATDGLVYFIQEMICKASQDRDWVDTMYQTSSMIKERRDTVIARVLSAHKIGKPPSHPENVTSSVGPLVSTPADECNTLESAIVVTPDPIHKSEINSPVTLPPKKFVNLDPTRLKSKLSEAVRKRLDSESDSEVEVVLQPTSRIASPCTSPPALPPQEIIDLYSTSPAQTTAPQKFNQKKRSRAPRKKKKINQNLQF